jgi:membrane protein implicated in regulation of membrane protease activity
MDLKRFIIIACNVGSLLIILEAIGARDMLIMLLLVGLIPGTDIIISPTQMLIVISIMTILMVYLYIISPLVRRIAIDDTRESNLTSRRKLKRV